jgi:predicted transposase YbfD/YdcC
MAQSSVETYPVMSIAEHFGRLTDPRMEERVEHRLLDIIVIAICGVICGADSGVEIEEFGKAKPDWLKGFLDLPNGIPSPDTFGRVFGCLSASQFQACFMSWIEGVFRATDGQGVAIDGKRLRGSYDRSSDKAAIHRVSAWACANWVVLGQVKTQEKSNEITAIPELLKLLELKGCIVSIDAMGCQKEIAERIIDQGGDYVARLKGNQGQLHEDVVQFFEYAQAKGFKDIPHSFHETLDADHGRIEIQRYWTVDRLDWLEDKAQWKGFNLIGMVESERDTGGKVTLERRYYLSSLDNQATRFAQAVRGALGDRKQPALVIRCHFPGRCVPNSPRSGRGEFCRTPTYGRQSSSTRENYKSWP